MQIQRRELSPVLTFSPSDTNPDCSGVGHKPALDLSLQHHNFGACFVKQSGMEAAKQTLRLKNNDTSDLSFDIE